MAMQKPTLTRGNAPFSGDEEVINAVLSTLEEVTTYDRAHIQPHMTLMGYLQMDPDSDIPLLVNKLNRRLGIMLRSRDVAEDDIRVTDLVELVETELELG